MVILQSSCTIDDTKQMADYGKLFIDMIELKQKYKIHEYVTIQRTQNMSLCQVAKK
jgi:hypothetical protein